MAGFSEEVLFYEVSEGGGKGFDGNARIKHLLEVGREDSFEERLYAENGRGIMIMAAWMDRVLYNRAGNEVLLVKRL